MYTSGTFLHAALRHLSGFDVPGGAAGVRWAVHHGLAARLPQPDVAQAALERLLVYLQASQAHHASDQRGMVWEAVRDAVIAPVIGLGSRS